LIRDVTRPQLLLVPEFTELTWTIRPSLEEWAEVASFELPGVGEEPLPKGDPKELDRELVVKRGLREVEEHGWDRFFIAADGWAIATAAGIAHARADAVAGMALGHAGLSFRRDGERAPINAAVWDAMTQLLSQDHEAFIRYGIAQATGGSIGEDLAQRMIDRFPRELMLLGWERVTADDDPFGDLLKRLECPMLLAKHEGCLMSTDEGFEDAVAALSGARTIAVPDAPSTSADFARAIRTFCEELWSSEPAEPSAAGEPLSGTADT
jgi:hypothetical protein